MRRRICTTSAPKQSNRVEVYERRHNVWWPFNWRVFISGRTIAKDPDASTRPPSARRAARRECKRRGLPMVDLTRKKILTSKYVTTLTTKRPKRRETRKDRR